MLLFAATFAVYAQTAHFDFVNFDDPDYVTANPHVRGGFTAANVAWAFTSGDAANWFPLTRLSHMLDYQLFGMAGGWHHLTNVLLHAVSVLLLFAFLHRATAPAMAQCVGGVPVRAAPSTRGIGRLGGGAEGCAQRRVRHAGAVELCPLGGRPSARRYLLVVGAFGLGLMAKPMIVTLPLLFVLLDIWPARRRRAVARENSAIRHGRSFYRDYLLVQQAGGAVRTTEQFPLPLRLENAAVSYVVYLLQWFWPARLAVFYPYPAEIPLWQAAAATIAIAAVSIAAFRSIRRHPYLTVGWFWYLIMLAPVIGLVQVGAQARADRYTYMPAIGISIVLAWGAAEFFTREPSARPAVTALAAVSCAAVAAVTWVQLGVWTNSRTLFQHAVDVTANNYLAHHNLGVALAEMPGGAGQAIAQFQSALRIKPNYLRAHTDLGSAYAKVGRFSDAMAEFRAAIAIDPGLAIPHNNLGNAYSQLGMWNEAISEYRTALRLDPEYTGPRNSLAEAEYTLGLSLAKAGRKSEAAAHLEAALQARPDYPEAHNNLGVVLSQDPARTGEAIAHFEAALRLDPNYADAHVNLGLALSQLPGRIPDAVAHLQAAERIQPDPEVRQMVEKLIAEKH